MKAYIVLSKKKKKAHNKDIISLERVELYKLHSLRYIQRERECCVGLDVKISEIGLRGTSS